MPTPDTPRAYWIAHVTVTDPARYKGYQALAPAAFRKFGARFLAQGGETVPLEGPTWDRHVVIEFVDRDTALACYHSEEYQTARARRSGACKATVMIVDGLSPS